MIISEKASQPSCDIRSEFLDVLDNLTQYFKNCQEDPAGIVELSRPSEKVLAGWGVGNPKNLFTCQGSESSDVFLVDSDAAFFSEASGDLLLKILAAMKLSPDSVFICNAEDQYQTLKKMEQISPKVVVALGEKASQLILKTTQPIETLRGTFYQINGIRVMPTFHPAFLLRFPDRKKEVWNDMQQVMSLLES